MEEQTKRTVKNNAIKIMIVLLLFICAQYLFTGMTEKGLFSSTVYAATSETSSNAKATEDPNAGEYIRLTDLEWRSESRAGWGSLYKNRDTNGNKLSVKMEGAYYTFDYGIWAHATSNIYYDISGYSEKYHYLTMYVGINQTSSTGNGVKFWVYTSNNDKFVASGADNWTVRSDPDRVYKAGENAVFLKIDIRGAKYLRLQAYDNGSNGNDHSVYINPMLITDNYQEKASIYPDISEYDKKMKEYANKDLSDPNYELLVLQRKFISNVGSYALNRFIDEDPANQETIKWLMNDVENLRYYLLGGTPNGGYYNSLKQLTRLLKAYKSDFEITEEISEAGKELLRKKNPTVPTTRGNLYKRMAITLSLTHSTTVSLWMSSSSTNLSDAVTRYAIYKQMYEAGQFKATASVDMTPWFETYNIEEMRWVLGTLIDDEEILWLNEYVQSRIDAAPGSVGSLLTPHPYLAYVWPNYTNPLFYSAENDAYFNDLFAVVQKDSNGNVITDAEGNPVKKLLWDDGSGRPNYGMSRGQGIQKLWMNFRNKFGTGAVCGGISKSGHCIRGVNAIASAVVGQPGHAALLYYSQTAAGKGYWGIDNDVSGWAYSEKGERMLLGWGNDRTYVKGYNVPYMILAQEALNDYTNLQKAEELLMTIDVYKDDKAMQEQIYRKAIEAQSINLDAWAGLTKLYMADTTKTEEDYYNLMKEMMEALKCFPFPMYNLSNYISTKFTSDVYAFKFSLLQTKMLTEAKSYTGTEVQQPGVTRNLASHLLGQIDSSLASFSFDGENAEKIVLSSRFDGNGIRWDYSLDGKQTWHEVASTAEDHTHSLTKQELESITAENDIYIHIVGVNYSDENIYKIDILASQGLPTALYANDLENRLIAATPSVQWKLREEDEWTYYKDAVPDLTGNKTIIVRMGATGVYLAQTTNTTFNFTQNTDPETRRYIPVSHLSLQSFSTEATGSSQNGHAKNAIDANPKTRWHSAWGGTDRDKFMVIELDEVKNLTAIEYTPAAGGNGKIESAQILVSIDGETWTEVVSSTNWTYKNTNDVTMQSVDFEPAKAKYVKIVGKKTQAASSSASFITAAMFNFYENKAVTIVATFSFDGDNAGKIVLEDDYKNLNWQYSLDGGANWKNGTPEAQTLSESEIASINENDNMKVRFDTNGVEYLLNIKKQEMPQIPSSVYLNDWENKLIGLTNVQNLEWKREGDNKWKAYDAQEPVVPGNKKLFIRTKASGIFAASQPVEYQFNEDSQDETAQYIKMKRLSIHGYSTQSIDNNRPYYAPNAIDGNINTLWHTDFRYNVLQQPGKPFITIKLDEPTYVSALEFIQTQYKVNDPTLVKNAIVYVSMDGEGWTTAGRIDNCPKVQRELRRIDFAESIYGQYVKLEMDTYDMFTSAAIINLYEDTTKTEAPEIVEPIVTIEYSAKELTNQEVIATLVSENHEISITNNNRNATYTFTENGEFTFEYVDEDGNEGEMTARVSWIDKVAPIPTITYSTTEATNQNVIATITFDKENVAVMGGNTYTFTENGEYTFGFVDIAGNAGVAVATVDWIDREAPKAKIEYNTTNPTNQDVVATITFDKENVTVKDGDTHTFTDNGDYTFEFTDGAGNTGTAKATVTWIDKSIPKASFSYDIAQNTNQNVTVTISFDKENVTILNNEGSNSYTFTDNGEFTFEFMGVVGTRDRAIARVDWIDKSAPVATIEYSITKATHQPVVATVTFDKQDVTIKNNAGKNTYTFADNGEFTFEYMDQSGNEGTAKATVSWIDKTLPVATITYSTTKLTNQDVVATITFDEENVTVEGGNTHTFTKNGEYVFSFEEQSGNSGVAVAKVDWIDKELPVATIHYSKTTPTNGEVIAEITFDKENVTVEGGNICIFRDNGEYTFRYRDEAGNTGAEDAVVSWIDKEAPMATIEYDITHSTKRNVTATIKFDKENVTVRGGATHLFTDNGEYTFDFVDEAGNTGRATAYVDWIDRKIPVATITYSTTELTNQDVIATITFDEENVMVEGGATHTFAHDGQHVFTFTDEAGNEGTATAVVNWIDKQVPFATITYSTTETTNGEVVASIIFDKRNVTVKDGDTHTFTENGQYTFEYEDQVGNKGTAIATVTWIKKDDEEEFIFKSDKYKIEENYISMIRPKVDEIAGTTVEEFKANITTNQELEVVDKEGNVLEEDAIVATGMTLKVGENFEYIFVVTGDLNGDGKVSVTDLAKLQLYFVGKEELKKEQARAVDIDGNGKITITDIAAIQLVLIGLKVLE